MSTLSLFVNKPCIESVEAAFSAVLETHQFSIHQVSFDDDLLRLIHEAKPCVCVFSQADGVIRKEVLGLLEKLKELRIASHRPLKDPSFRILLVAQESGIPTRNWGDLGVHEIIVAPVLPKALAFKLSRHHQKAIAAYEIEKLAEADETTPIQETELQEQRPPGEWRNFLQKPTELTVIPKENTRERVTIQLSGDDLPNPDQGEWIETRNSPDEEPTWNWNPKGASSAPISSSPQAKKFSQDTQPKRNKWQFEGEKPTYDRSKKTWTFSGKSPRLKATSKDASEDQEPQYTDVVLYSEKAVNIRSEFEKGKSLQVHEIKKQTFAIKKQSKKDSVEKPKSTPEKSDAQASLLKRAAPYLSTPNKTPEKEKPTASALAQTKTQRPTKEKQTREETEVAASPTAPKSQKEIEAQELEDFLDLNFDVQELEEASAALAESEKESEPPATTPELASAAPDLTEETEKPAKTEKPKPQKTSVPADAAATASKSESKLATVAETTFHSEKETTEEADFEKSSSASESKEESPLSAFSSAPAEEEITPGSAGAAEETDLPSQDPSEFSSGEVSSPNETPKTFSNPSKSESGAKSFSKEQKNQSVPEAHTSTDKIGSQSQKSSFKNEDPKSDPSPLKTFSKESSKPSGYGDKSDPNFKEHSTWSMGGMDGDEDPKKQKKKRDADLKKIEELQKEKIQELEAELQLQYEQQEETELRTSQNQASSSSVPPQRKKDESDQDWLSRLSEFFKSLFK